MSTELALPIDGDSSKWTEREKALVTAAGLVSNNKLADRPTVEAFLAHCNRTGLDPIARQIYAIERGGKWNIQVSIDGARLVAERSGQYQGQTPVQWTADGEKWVDVWLSDAHPAAARVGVYRQGFVEPLYAVATWAQYNAGGPMWKKMPSLMLGKCAEMLALRKAFPQDLSGLYSAEEMDQAGSVKPVAVEVSAEVLSDADWLLLKKSTEAGADKVALRAVYAEFRELGLLKGTIPGTSETVHDFLMKASAPLPERVEEVEAVLDAPHPDLLAEVEAEVIADVVTGEVVEPVTEWDTAVIPGADAA